METLLEAETDADLCIFRDYRRDPNSLSHFGKRYSSCPLPDISLSKVSLTLSQLRAKNNKWKITEINISRSLNFTPFWVSIWNLAPFCSIPPSVWIIPSSSITTLYTLSTHQSLGCLLSYRTLVVSRCLRSRNMCFTSQWPQSTRAVSDAGDSEMPKWVPIIVLFYSLWLICYCAWFIN